MNIIIPLAGQGIRFKNYGYTEPKPLIKALGKEIILWVIENLKIKKEDNIFIIYEKGLDNYDFKNKFIRQNINFYKLDNHTNGPVETISLLIRNFSEQQLNQSTLILDGDTFYEKDILKIIRKKSDPIIFYHKTKIKEPIFSYIKVNQEIVVDIKEKIKISNNANTGAYFFFNTSQLKKYLNLTLKKNNKSYVSDIYQKMINDNVKIKTSMVKNNEFHCLGTPEQLQNFSKNYKTKKLNFCFDFENVIINIEENNKNKEFLYPNFHNIELIKSLKKSGHNISIKSNQTNNTDQIRIKNFLKKLNIKYDEIFFNQPIFDFHIGSNNFNAKNNISFNLGFYKQKQTRQFNSIQIFKNFTEKKSTNKKILNEILYYKKIPQDLIYLFPKILSFSKNSYKLETIDGATFSDLFLNNILNVKHIDILLFHLRKIHEFKAAKKEKSKFIYSNYRNKLDLRKNKIKSLVGSIFSELFFKDITDHLNLYQKNDAGFSGIIHGDPVFSNIFFLKNNKVKFIDPRGGQLGKFSIYGDIFYDYAKIYQSLIGYEHIINGKSYNQKIFTILIKHFESYFIDKWGMAKFKYLYLLTSSLYLSLIPFHDQKFARLFYSKSKKTFMLFKKF